MGPDLAHGVSVFSFAQECVSEGVGARGDGRFLGGGRRASRGSKWKRSR